MKMEETTVLIVGAGPSGLALAALLARMNVKACTQKFARITLSTTHKLIPEGNNLGERGRSL